LGGNGLHLSVWCLSAPCSSGKTRAACRFIAKRIAAAGCTESFIYVAPSKLLLEQVRAELDGLGVDVVAITSDTDPKQVVKALLRHLQRFTEGGQVLLVSHQAYFGLPYFPQHGGWRAIIDEMPQLDRCFALAEPRDVALLISHLEQGPLITPRLAQLRVKHKSRLKTHLTGVDDRTSSIAKLFIDALSPNKDLYVDLESWNGALASSSATETKPVNVISILNKRAFQGHILMGANVEHSLVGAMLRHNGVRFLSHQQITSGLRYRTYPTDLGSRLKVQYVLEGRAWSKTFRDSMGTSARKVMEEVEEVVLAELGDTPYLLAANNDYNGVLAQHLNCVRLPVIAHGLNTYAHHTNLVFIAALNRHPVHHRLLRSLGYSNEVIRRSTADEILHQILMRTNLRVPDSDAMVRVIVPDRKSADFLATLLPGCNVSRIGKLAYDRLPPLTSKERKNRHKLRKVFVGPPRERTSIRVLKEDCSFSGSAAPPPGGNVLTLTYCGSLYCKLESEFNKCEMSPLDLVAYLKLAARTPYDTKDDLLLVGLTVFDPGIDALGYRRQANIKVLYGLILDYDGGNLSPEEFERIFWPDDKSKPRFAFIICSTFSRCADDPNRFRVFIPFRSPTTSLRMFQALHDLVVERMEKHGFTRSGSKLDPICRAGNQFFRFPGRNRQHPEWSFCRAHGLKRTRDFERYALDPATYEIVSERTAHTAPSKPEPPMNFHNQRWHSSPAVCELQRQIREMHEDRHDAFFRMGIELRSTGYALDTIQEILVDTAGDDEKMLKKATDIIMSLRRYEEQDGLPGTVAAKPI
jgi:hypothetical protein